MYTLLKQTLVIAFIGTLLSACVSKQTLSESQVAEKYQAVATLEQAISKSNQPMLSLLSQRSFEQATQALKEAKALAAKDKPEAIEAAARGERQFKLAEDNAQKARELFSEVLDARTQAINHGALTQLPKQLAVVEADFKKMTLDLEQGDLESAKMRRPSIIERYKSLELTALKKATVETAKQAIAKARALDADKYAKQTFEMAEEELALALSMLDADKTSKEKADQHAAQAIWLAEKSSSITATIKSFKANDFSSEDIVLWHQAQLEKAMKPLNKNLPFNLPDKNLIESIAHEVASAVKQGKQTLQQRDDLQESLSSSDAHLKQAIMTSQQEQRALKAKYEVEQQQRDEKQARENEKLAFIQGLFTPEQANVYREKDDILIRSHGFYFPSGQSEIDSRNFAILQKISAAIGQYPNSSVLVTGHTDAMGDDTSNLSLSEQRAEKVMKFLNEVGGISLARLSSKGLGEQKPVASNDSREGREANRRVEVLIVTQ